MTHDRRHGQTALGLGALGVGLALAQYARRRRTALSFRGRTAVVTGGSRGLGFELGRQLAMEGARVWLVARSAEPLARAADELRQTGAFVETIAADVRRPDGIDRIVDRLLAAGDHVDLLINNAGTMEVGPFAHLTEDDYRDSLDTHFWAPLRLIQRFLPHIPRGSGRIVNISSIGGRIGVPHLSAYAAGKFALTGLSETLGAELAKSGIAVTTVTPGLMRTGSYVNVRLRGRHPEEFRWFAAMAALPITSMAAPRAARQILAAARAGRATVTPGWQARMAEVLSAVAPNTFAHLSAAADRLVLPPPAEAERGDRERLAADVDPGRIKALLSARNRRRFRQPSPVWA